MVITRNSLGHLEVPDVILCKASEERVGVLQCTKKTWTHKFNDLDTLSLEIPYLTDDKHTPFYDDIDIMKYIEVPSIGRFCIKDIDIVSEGQKTEYKKIECTDYSCILGQRYLEEFTINIYEEGTGSIDDVLFFNPGLQSKSLLHLILEKFPEWTYDYVDPALQTMKRSFEVTRQDVYSFMTKDISEAFECVFVFNSLAKTINVYEVDTYGKDTCIHVSYNSLLENTELSYSIDDIKTALTLQGDSDKVNVRDINMGNDIIYNFDYYASEEYFSASLLSAYNTWKNLVNTTVDTSLFSYKPGVITQADLKNKTYNQAYTFLLGKYQDYYTSISKWTSTMMPDGINTRYPGYGKILFKDSSGNDYYLTFAKQTKWMLVGSDEQNATINETKKVYTAKSLPSTGDTATLYLMKNTNVMKRWLNGKYYDVNTWIDCSLATLKEHQAAAAKNKKIAADADYGERSKNEAEYINTYLPQLYAYNALEDQIEVVNTTITTLKSDQAVIQYDKNVVVNKVAMKNNFTTTQLTELSTFIREDNLSSSNFYVGENMTEDERFEMLYLLLDYGQKELAKVSAPQIQFSAGINNLFAIPEFDAYSGDFDIGNYVWVTLRDDYFVKAKILEVSIDFLDQSKFSVTFGNVMKKAKNIFTDVTEALNAATSAATSVSFNQSYWSASAEETNSIGDALSKGLLSQSYYLSNNPANNEVLIDDTGLWITTTDDANHGRLHTPDYDSIYLGGGRMLFTSDGWRNVRMSVGRADVDFPYIDSSGNISFVKESRFGVFADFLIAGYVGGSTIVGGDIYSDGYSSNASNKNSGNFGTHINLRDGTFEFNSPQSFKAAGKAGKKRLRLYVGKDANNNDIDILEMNGTIYASKGNIGSDDNGSGGFIIENLKLYSGKTSFNDASHSGIYLGSDSRATESSTNGISLGKYGAYKSGRNPFSVDMTGKLVANYGEIANFTLTESSLYSGSKKNLTENVDGVFVGDTGIALGKQTSYTTTSGGTETKSAFQVDNKGVLYAGNINVKGRITATSGYIGNGASGFTITSTAIYNGKTSLTDMTNEKGVYIGTNGISLGRINTGTSSDPVYKDAFKVTSAGALTSTSGSIGGWTIGADTISHKSGSNTITISAKENNLNFNGRIKINGDGSFEAANGLFTISTDGKIHSKGGDIGGFTITANELYKTKTTLDDVDHSGVYIGTTGIALGHRNIGTTDAPEYVEAFKVTSAGVLTATRGTIGGWTINTTYLANGKTSLTNKVNGIYIGQTGISLGYDKTNKLIPFTVDSDGVLTATSGSIGGWSITKDSISRSTKIDDVNTEITLDATNNKINVNNKIYINGDGTINTGSKTGLDIDSTGLFISSGGIALGYKNAFKVTDAGVLTATSGKIGGWTITSNALSNGKLKDGVPDIDADAAGIFIGQTGISLGKPGKDDVTGNLIHKFKVTSGGALTCTSGHIGGWKINANTLTGGNMTINSEGSIKHSSKWSIDKDGNAEFTSIKLNTNVTIKDVKSGSFFGSLNYKDGVTYGNFTGASYFGPDENISPFSGGASKQIGTLAVAKLEAEWLEAEGANVGKLKSSLLTADNITAGTMSADRISGGSIDATNVTIKNLTVSTANITGSLSANKITSGNVNGYNVSWQTCSVLRDYKAEQMYDRDGKGFIGLTSLKSGDLYILSYKNY